LLVLAVAVLAVGGCSAVKLAYGTLPGWTYWWLDGHLDFPEAQGGAVRDELARLHAWHRERELPQWIELLGRLEPLLAGAISPAQACAFVPRATARLDSVGRQAEAGVLAIAAGLRPGQIRHLERRHRTRNDEWRREWLDVAPAERQALREKRAAERLETIYGPLDEAQRAVLRASLDGSAFDPARSLALRQARQHDLVRTLRRLADPATPAADAPGIWHAWLDRMQRAPDAAQQAYQQALVDEGCRIFAAVHASTTAAQREHAVRRLRGWQRDLRELAAAR